MEGNNAPFVVGQKVIALQTVTLDGAVVLAKDDVFTVLKTSLCCCWQIDIGIKLPYEMETCVCGKCLFKFTGNCWWALASLFAPIQTQYTDISKEIADSIKHTEEVPDKIMVPQTVNN